MLAEVRAGLALARSLTGGLCSAFHPLQVARAVAKGAMNLLEIHFSGGNVSCRIVFLMKGCLICAAPAFTI